MSVVSRASLKSFARSAFPRRMSSSASLTALPAVPNSEWQPGSQSSCPIHGHQLLSTHGHGTHLAAALCACLHICMFYPFGASDLGRCRRPSGLLVVSAHRRRIARRHARTRHA
jgi:hypothetical protein